MDIICIMGPTPGPVIATVAHGGRVAQVAMELGRHHAGGWHARRGQGPWGLRCRTVNTAVLLEASDAFTDPEPAAALAPPSLQVAA